MWNKNKSLILSIVLTVGLLVLLTGFSLFMPWLLQLYIELLNRTQTPTTELLVTFYCCVPLGYTILGTLLKILFNIKKGLVFVKSNVTLLRILSWAIFAVTFICFIGGMWYLPFLIVSAAALFIGVIVRVIVAVLNHGTAIKDDNDLTI